MIKINTCHISDYALSVEGLESAEILELPSGGGLSAGGEIHYKLSASMTGMDLLVTGTVELAVTAECGCCLDSFPMKLFVKDVCHLYENAEGKEIDVTDDIREDLLLALPIVFKCSPGCKGICPGCGANLNREKCTCGTKKNRKKKTGNEDPASPWDALSALKF